MTEKERRIRNRAERLIEKEMLKLQAGEMFTAERSISICKMCLRIASELETMPLPERPE